MVCKWNTAGQVSAECRDNSVTSKASLLRSTGILMGVLSVTVFGMGVWFDSLQSVTKGSPIVSLQWINGSVIHNVVAPEVLFDGEEIPTENGVQYQNLSDQLRWIENKLLEEDIEEQNISNETIRLDYIDFFAGVEIAPYRYAAYRLLRQKKMFLLSDSDFQSEIEYLFPDVPINIQGREGERLLMNNQEIVGWKTEVLEQQAFVKRFRQYLVKRRYEERGRIGIQALGPTLELRMGPDWYGWVNVAGVLSIEGCPSVSIKQYDYKGDGGYIRILLPLWKLNDDCRQQYSVSRLTSLTYLSIKTTIDDGFMNPMTKVWRMSTALCNHSVNKMTSECLE